MAFMNDIKGFEGGLVRGMRRRFEETRRAAARRKVYRNTLSELSTLTQRELDDLGIARENITEVAARAVYDR